MAVTTINSEDRLVQATFAELLERVLSWDSVYAWNRETFGPDGTLGRADTKEAVLIRDLRAALERLNPDLPASAIDDVLRELTVYDFSRSMVQHNRDFYRLIRGGVLVQYRDAQGRQKSARARVIDFDNAPGSNRFLAVRELKLTGVRTPNYNRRADLVCFVNGLPLVFIELKAVHKNIREGFDNNLADYMDENVIAHAFHHNAFLIVSNGDRARYGSITSEWGHFAEWKRHDEAEKGSLEAEVLLNGMLAHDRLLDIVENSILFDDSKPGATRKVIARNHQVLGVNRAVDSVTRQEELKLEFPSDQRLRRRVVELPLESRRPAGTQSVSGRAQTASPYIPEGPINIIERAHPNLGRLGVFWHTQGSGKSYSMGFFAEKVRRKLEGNFTFLLMTDRNDLDSQIYRTFVGCGIADDQTPRAASGDDLEKLLKENHRYVFSLIHKFNKDVDPEHPYSVRDDIIVISDEAHRTQAGRLARNMRLALPNASFIGFTGTPLFKQDELTKRIFGDYVSRYDFKRSEEDGSTVKLVYESRGEKLGVERTDLNPLIATRIEEAELDPDQAALLEKLLGQDYEVITADERLKKIAADFVEHCAARWQSGKSMLVCIDKITCARMLQLIVPIWQVKAVDVRGEAEAKWREAELADDGAVREALAEQAGKLTAQADWMDETIVEIIISEAQNEVADFKKWDFDIIPHRARMKQGFEMADGQRVDVETAFKDPDHPFRVAVVCAMWMTGFDVECLSTLYIDKPMRAHTLMQAIARANRVYPGKEFGLIVDYNGMLRSLREALAQYALGDDGTGTDGEEIVVPIEESVQALIEAIEATEAHLRSLGFDPKNLIGSTGFARIQLLKDGVEAVYTSDESKRRFEVLARQVFSRFKALAMEPTAFSYAERHDNVEAIYKKLSERRDTADVTELLKELHRIVNEAIRTREPGDDQAKGLTFDLSQIDVEKLRDEFAKRVTHKATALQDIREIVEQKLAEMLARNPRRMDYQEKYEEIVAAYNREKNRATIEETFQQLSELMQELDEEQRRAIEEGLTEGELALFDLLKKDDLGRAERERVKQSSRDLLAAIKEQLAELDRFWEKEQTKAELKVFILDEVFTSLPTPPFTVEEKEAVANDVYAHIWQQAVSGEFAKAA